MSRRCATISRLVVLITTGDDLSTLQGKSCTNHINDLTNCLKDTTPRIFGDDTSLTACEKSIDEIELGLSKDLESIRLWLQANKLSLNVAKIVSICSSIHVKD